MRRRRVTRDAILEVAIPLFREQGYRRARLEDVAAALGVTRPALYDHFKTKEDILIEMIARLWQDTMSLVEDLRAKDLPVGVKFLRLLAGRIEKSAGYPEATGVFFDEMERANPDLVAIPRAQWKELNSWLEELYAEGVAAGQFVDIDAGVAVRTIFGAANWVHRWYRPDGRYTPRELAEEMARLLLNGFQHREGSDARLPQTVFETNS